MSRLALTATGAALAVIAPACTAERAAVTAAAWQAELTRALPPGTPIAEVRARLTAMGIEHSDPVPTAELAHMGRRGAEAAAAGATQIHAIRRNVAAGPLVRTDLAAILRFDADSRLTSISVETVRTAL